MAINLNHYHSYGNNYRIILRHHQFGPGLVFFSKHDVPSGGWVARRFDDRSDITHKDMELSAAAIEQGADYSEFPPPYSVQHTDEWKAYLALRLKALVKAKIITPDVSAPRPNADEEPGDPFEFENPA